MDTGKPVSRRDFCLPAAPGIDIVGVRGALTVPLPCFLRFQVEHTANIAAQATQRGFVNFRRSQLRPVVDVIVRGLHFNDVFDPLVWRHLDPGGVTDPDDQRDAIGLFVIDGCQHPFPGSHWHLSPPRK